MDRRNKRVNKQDVAANVEKLSNSGEGEQIGR